MSNLSYSEQINAEIKKSHRLRDTARLLYYTQALKNSQAVASYETFKGSWAHTQWLETHGKHIAERRDSTNRRFGWCGEWV